MYSQDCGPLGWKNTSSFSTDLILMYLLSSFSVLRSLALKFKVQSKSTCE